MAEFWGAIERFLGGILSGIYGVVPQYGVAIILLTILVRLVLFPLAVKQIRSMTAMQKVNPKVQELRKKYKNDRQKLNEEMMKLYREHGVNPLGGCFPMLLQMPVFIALYAVIRSSIVFDASIESTRITIPITKDTSCRPVGDNGSPKEEIRCQTGSQEQVFQIASGAGSVLQVHSTQRFEALPGYTAFCTLPKGAKRGSEVTSIRCTSPLGTGHLPKDSKLFDALSEDRATFLGMHLACSPTQASSDAAVKLCTAEGDKPGAVGLGMYYVLVLLMAGTTYYQQRQMLARQAGSPQAQQMQLMAKIMPVFMGFLSLNFPAALSLYWVVGNFWMIGQQHFILKAQDEATGAPAKAANPTPERPPKGRPPVKKPNRPNKRR